MGIIRRNVALAGIRFFAFHGYYPEEQLVGCEFIVDVAASLDVANGDDDDLSQTINYELLFEIVSRQMKLPRKLIETVAHAILEEIKQEFPYVATIDVSIRKMHPPLAGEVNSSVVSLAYTR